MSIHVLVIDDNVPFRNGILSLIKATPDLVVVGEGSSATDAEELLRTTRTDVLLVDASLPDGSGLEVARATRERNATVGIVVLTTHNDDGVLLGALDAGASALVLKSASADEVTNAVRRAAAAPDAFSANGLAAAMHRQPSAEGPGGGANLTSREGQVLRHLVAGESVTQVAHHLSMRESAVRAHIGRVYDKLGAENRATTPMARLRLALVSPYEASPIGNPGHSCTPGPRRGPRRDKPSP